MSFQAAPTDETITITLGDKTIDLPVVVGTEGEHALDISKLRAETGYITLDVGYRNTGSCASEITFINPEQGVLRYRGYPIEQVAEKLTFYDTCYLLINGNTPTIDQANAFAELIHQHRKVDRNLIMTLCGFPTDANPMAMLSAAINGLCGYHPEVIDVDYKENFEVTAAKLIGKVKTIAAAIHRHRNGQWPIDADPTLDYTTDLLRMMTGKVPDPAVAKALDQIFILHADHEQNCSAATCRMVGSSHANLFASCAAAVCALWGPLHGGANVMIMNQIESIHNDPDMDPDKFIAAVKDKKYRLFGFGHRVYKNYDPRARILKGYADEVLEKIGVGDDPLLDIALRLEKLALEDDYFVSRNLYPNVDFYSGIILRAMGIPTDMFTVFFALGRMPGWISQWKEVRDTGSRIYRPRQVYVGEGERDM